MENKQLVETPKPFLFDFLEEIQISSSASTYTNLGVTGVGSNAVQDSDDE
ncbi:hypothetical protein [Mucilaginibacter phyllosphaerae]|uniref:Bacteriocin n=1 Tax=Mucilaginibacter phyllosphaerae TaxID=1812349 RepID=A0ABR6I8D4_9SPHI|nr:hypothetical protein [Mucilaginibacter phyllosphaerae]MBB3969301.1 hypothetical protein [Mucilaginibacter phyllosphaerae]GGH07530.1 hypothetical protein GCM10007352_12350 [Mucilaginibacter phyllosphaerae]